MLRFIFVFFLLCCSVFVSAQMITQKDGACGLVSADGEVLLKPEYDFVKTYDHFPRTYAYRKDSKYGIVCLDKHYDSGLVYDSLFAGNARFVMKKGNKYGFVSPRSSRSDSVSIVEPKFDQVYYLSTTEIVVRVDSLYGVYSLFGGVSEIMPARFSQPLYNSNVGLYSYKDPAGGYTFIGDRDSTGNYPLLNLPVREPVIVEDYGFYYLNNIKNEITFWHGKTLKKGVTVELSDTTARWYYDKYLCVVVCEDPKVNGKIEKHGRKTIRWFNPFTGEEILAEIVSSGERIQTDCTGINSCSAGKQTYDAVVRVGTSRKIKLGMICCYKYSPLKTPQYQPKSTKTFDHDFNPLNMIIR